MAAESLRVGAKSFEPRKGFRPEEHVSSSFGAQTQPGGRIPVRLRIGAAGSHFVRERVWHPSQRVTVAPDGSVEVAYEVSDQGDLLRWVLSFGSDADVLEPADLRAKVLEEARKVLRRGGAAEGGVSGA